MPTISEQKKELRIHMKHIIHDFCATHDFVQASQKARYNVLQTGLLHKADIILGYLFHGEEADCSDLLYRALNMQKTVALPRVVPHTTVMDFYVLDGLLNFGDQITTGAFGMSEPIASLEKIAVDQSLAQKHILVLVPGVAFTPDGKRLGHGKGFYDRYIARLEKTGARITLAGFCFPCQIIAQIPTDTHDKTVDIIFSSQPNIHENQANQQNKIS